MDRAEVEVAFGRDIGDVGRDVSLFAQFPYNSRCLWVVDGGEDHIHLLVRVEVGRLELSVDVGYLTLCDAVGHLRVETGGRAYYSHDGIGIETVEDAAGSDLVGEERG